MPDNTLVSVVLPCYNGEKYLPMAIESVLRQTYHRWELVLVNDCSTDSTLSMKRYAEEDSRIRVIENSENKKLPGSLNIGFRASQGHFLTWTSDDNLLKPEMMQAFVEAFAMHPDAGLIFSDFTEIDEDSKPTRKVVVEPPEQLIRHNCIMASFMYTREVFENTGEYDETIFLAEDYDYWLRISEKFRLIALHKDLYFYRRHSGSLTAQRRREVHQAIRKALIKNIDRLKWIDPSLRARACLSLASHTEGRERKQLLRKAFRINPFLTGYNLSIHLFKN